MQYFDKDWSTFVDLEDCNALSDRAHLKCIIINPECPSAASSVHVNAVDQVNTMPVEEQQPTDTRRSWPLEYKLPKVFPPSVSLALKNKINLKGPSHRKDRGEFVRCIVADALMYKNYPDRAEKTDMARAIIREFPHLRESSGNGFVAGISRL